ncbi:MAG: hypothetical protein ACYSWZ_15580 [Planctomycetota bacterium]
MIVESREAKVFAALAISMTVRCLLSFPLYEGRTRRRSSIIPCSPAGEPLERYRDLL